MKLTIVGCSGSVPGPEAGCSCYLVEHDGFRLLLDLGSGSCGPLMRYAAPESLDQVLISHAHGDHYADLVSLAYHRGRAQAVADAAHQPPIPRPLRLIGPSDLPAAIPWLTRETGLYSFEPAVAGVTEAGPMRLRLARVEHGDMEVWAARVDDWLCYTADTGPGEAIDELAAGCRVLLAEASGLDGDYPRGGHLTARTAGELATRSRARLLVITHLRSWMDADAILAEATRYAECPVVRALPGLTIA
ncbi:MAG TPA: MBL fold metallo-hydrolase [Candidatus Limnocylindrales bacterium]|nr:MBL fold metallo-hydrolase [Candidatus Limnocylindrales bacterium]